jgi:hypothetical protein
LEQGKRRQFASINRPIGGATHDKVLPIDLAMRAECFYAYAPTKIEYAIDRFAMEVRTRRSPSDQLHERHDASDLDTKTQDKLVDPKNTSGG